MPQYHPHRYECIPKIFLWVHSERILGHLPSSTPCMKGGSHIINIHGKDTSRWSFFFFFYPLKWLEKKENKTKRSIYLFLFFFSCVIILKCLKSIWPQIGWWGFTHFHAWLPIIPYILIDHLYKLKLKRDEKVTDWLLICIYCCWRSTMEKRWKRRQCEELGDHIGTISFVLRIKRPTYPLTLM